MSVWGWFESWASNRSARQTRERASSEILSDHKCFAIDYLNAFDTPPCSCPFCGRELKKIFFKTNRQDPHGRAHEGVRFLGYFCRNCEIAAIWDIAKADEFRKLGEFLTQEIALL